MNLEFELIDDERQIKDFLYRHMQMAGMPIHIQVKSSTKEFSVGVETETKRNALSFHLEAGKELTLRTIFSAFKFGPLGLKCILAVAASRDYNYLLLKRVRHNGLSFWPRRGSVPHRGQGLSAASLQHFLDRNAPHMDENVRQDVEAIIQVATYSRLWAWRLMSQSDARFRDGRFVRHAVFQNIVVPDHNEVVLLGETTTRKILTERLSPIPPFRNFTGEFPDKIKEFAVRPIEAAQLKF